MTFRSILFGLLVAWLTIVSKGGHVSSLMSEQLPAWSKWTWQPALFIGCMLIAMTAWVVIERCARAVWEGAGQVGDLSEGGFAGGYDKVQH